MVNDTSGIDLHVANSFIFSSFCTRGPVYMYHDFLEKKAVKYLCLNFCSVKENLHHMMRSDDDFNEDSYKHVSTCVP